MVTQARNAKREKMVAELEASRWRAQAEGKAQGEQRLGELTARLHAATALVKQVGHVKQRRTII